MVTGIDTVVDPDVPISSIVVVPRDALLVALHRIVTFEVPFAGGVAGSAEAVADTPLGNSFTPSVTAAWNPLTLVTVSVVLVVPFSSTVNDDGDSFNVNVALPVVAALTVSAIVVECVSEPDVPVIVTVAVPVAAVALAVSVSVLVALPLAAGVTGFVLNDAVTPLGRPLAVSVTALANRVLRRDVIVLVPFAPCVTVTLPATRSR